MNALFSLLILNSLHILTYTFKKHTFFFLKPSFTYPFLSCANLLFSVLIFFFPHLQTFKEFILVLIFHHHLFFWASQVALMVKNPPANGGDIRDVGSIPELGRSPGGWESNPLQYLGMENPMDRGAWWAMVHGVSKNQT